MSETDWLDRLAAGIEATNKSQREISIAAGVGPGYVNSLFNEGKDPTIGNLRKVCAAAGLSIYYVLGGFDITPEKEQMLRLLDRVDEDVQRSVLTLLRRGRQTEDSRAPGA